MSKSIDSLVKLTDSQLMRLIYSSWDFKQAHTALKFLMQDCDFEQKYSNTELRRFRCYETSVIVSFSRPFDGVRGQTALGLKAIGVELSNADKELKERIISLRHTVIAHSAEEFMHFKGHILKPFEDSDIQVPFHQFNESLHLEESDLRPLEMLLHMLMGKIYKALFDLAQIAPNRLNLSKSPTPHKKI